jgi:hypothetical protein
MLENDQSVSQDAGSAPAVQPRSEMVSDSDGGTQLEAVVAAVVLSAAGGLEGASPVTAVSAPSVTAAAAAAAAAAAVAVSSAAAAAAAAAAGAIS